MFVPAALECALEKFLQTVASPGGYYTKFLGGFSLRPMSS